MRRLSRGKTHGRVSAAVAGTGLSPQAVSTYFLRRSEQQNGGKPRYRHYLKWLVVVDVKQQVVLAQQARQGPWVDTRALPGLVDAAARKALFRHNLAGVFRKEPCAARCTALFLRKSMDNERKWKRSSPW